MPAVSSTEVRRSIAAGEPVEGLVPRAVLDYIYRLRTLQGSGAGARMSYMSEAEVNARVLAEGPAEPTPSVFIMGAGVVGTALAAWLVRAGLPVIGLHGRQVDLSDAARAISGVVASTGDIPDIIAESDVVVISVRDERVPEVAQRLAHERPPAARADRVAHIGREPGAHDPFAGGAARRARSGRCTRWCRSPIRASPIEGLNDVAFGIEGDEPARAMAKRIVRRAGSARRVPRGRESGALSRGRGDGVELRRRDGRHGADAAGHGGRSAGSGAAGADPAAHQRRPEPGAAAACRAR